LRWWVLWEHQPLPPRFAFGYWWSRYWAYTDKEIEELVARFDEMKIPISVIVLTKNSARHVEACLASVRSFDEVVVYDNGSEDETLDIAERLEEEGLYAGALEACERAIWAFEYHLTLTQQAPLLLDDARASAVRMRRKLRMDAPPK